MQGAGADPLVHGAAACAPQRVVAWGYGIAHFRDATLGHHVEHCAFALGTQGLSFVADDHGAPLAWVPFAGCYHFDVGQDADGRWEILYDLLGPAGPDRALGFTVVETYGGLSPEACARYFASSVREEWLTGARHRAGRS
jgi:hypothetical protein